MRLNRLARLSSLSAPILLILVAVGLGDLYILLGLRAFPCLDARLYYSPQDVRDLFEMLGRTYRRQYMFEELVDLTFIAVYTLLLLNIARMVRACAGRELDRIGAW